MKTNVQQTSIDAYHDHPDKGGQCERIARWMLYANRPEGWTIGEVSRKLGMEKSTVSGRFNDLKKMDTVMIDFAEYDMLQVSKRKCTVSGITCQAWILAPRGTQLELFN